MILYEKKRFSQRDALALMTDSVRHIIILYLILLYCLIAFISLSYSLHSILILNLNF